LEPRLTNLTGKLTGITDVYIIKLTSITITLLQKGFQTTVYHNMGHISDNLVFWN